MKTWVPCGHGALLPPHMAREGYFYYLIIPPTKEKGTKRNMRELRISTLHEDSFPFFINVVSFTLSKLHSTGN